MAIEDDVHNMICDQNVNDYKGLERDCRTFTKIETAIRFFPNALSIGKEVTWGSPWQGCFDADCRGHYPIQCLPRMYGTGGNILNVKAISFIHVFAKLAIEIEL